MSELPRFQNPVRKSPCLHLLDGPLGGGFVVRRPGYARAVDVRKKVQRSHDLRMRRLLLANSGVDVRVDALLRPERNQNEDEGDQGQRAVEHGGLLMAKS